MVERESERGLRREERCKWRRTRLHGCNLLRRRGGCRLAGEVSTLLIIPGGFVVHLFLGIKSGVEAVFGQLESVFDNEGGVGEVEEIVLGDAVVRDSVVDHAAEECNVGASADLKIH